MTKGMWIWYDVHLHMTAPFASSSPKNPKDIEAMLEARAPSDSELKRRIEAGEQITPISELAEEVGEAVEADEEEERGHATFMRDEKGLYFEARCVKAHIKDCADQIKFLLEIKALKAKVSNKVYVEPPRIHFDKQEPDGVEHRIIHAMTKRGPRSSLKSIDYVKDVDFKFQLKVLNDGIIDKDILASIFEYGSTHGIGQERSQDFGRYNVVRLHEATKS